MANIDVPLLTVSQTFPSRTVGGVVFASLFSLAVSFPSGDLFRIPTRGGFKKIVWHQDPYRVIWALRTDGVLVSLTYRKDQNVNALSRHVFSGTVVDIAVIPHPDGTQDQLWMLIDRVANGVTTRRVERMAKEHVPATETDLGAFMLLDAAKVYSGAATSTLTGLSHLEGRSVDVVSNGRHLGSYLVASGAITLSESVTSAIVGLSYTSEIESVPLSPEGTLGRAGMKSVPIVWLNLLDTIGGEVAADRGDFVPLLPRNAIDPMEDEPPARTGVIAVRVLDGWNRDATVKVRQSDPLPMTLLDFVTTTRTSV